MHHQALVDGPSKTPNMAVPRHATALGNVILTHIVMPKLPRAAGRGAVARAWEKNEVEQKWEESAWAKRRAVREKRRNLTDFDRFRVLKLNKQVSPKSMKPVTRACDPGRTRKSLLARPSRAYDCSCANTC